ncbi:MAG: hypothetical protein NZ781_08780 [Armatimonadetes bacterium]|nr:hypothetical protein [Armatimonadota bacterium]
MAEYGFAELVLFLECFSLWIIAPLMAHSLFAMEFEKATWDMLILTRLTVSQIVMGKFLSRLVLLFIYISFFIPLIFISIGVGRKLSLYEILSLVFKTQLVAISWAIFLVAVTLWLSYRLKRAMLTAAAAFVGQVSVVVILPILWIMFLELIVVDFEPFYSSYWEMETTYNWMFNPVSAIIFYNPVFTLLLLFVEGWIDSKMSAPVLWGTWQGIVYLLLAYLLIVILIRSISKATRKQL